MPAFLSAPHVRHPASRLRALRARPQVAVSIDTEGFPPDVLLIRGVVEVAEVDGVPAEYRAAAYRYLGDTEAAAYLSTIDPPGTRMARIAVRPAWVGLVDFRTRQPSALGGIEPEVGS